MTVGIRLAALLKSAYEIQDFTLPESRNSNIKYDEDDMVVIASPVYAGRVPNKIMPYIRDSIKGHNTKCVAMVTFGNRAYDDALQELTKMMSDNGMKVIGAAAVCCEHSFASELATGHPNQSDEENMLEFAQKCFDNRDNHAGSVVIIVF